MSCNWVTAKIANMEYGNNGTSLTLLAPGLSLLILKVQTTHLLGKLNATYTKPDQVSALINSSEYKKLGVVFKSHALGSLIQTITLFALSKLNQAFLLPSLLSIYEICRSTKGIWHEAIEVKKGKLQIIR